MSQHPPVRESPQATSLPHSPNARGSRRGRWHPSSLSPSLQTAIGPCRMPDVLRFCQTDTAPRLYIYLATHVDKTQLTTLDYGRLSQALNITPSAAKFAARRLAKWHLIRQVTKGGGRGRKSLWRVTLLPIRATKTFSQNPLHEVKEFGSTHGLKAMSDTVAGVPHAQSSPARGQMSKEKWRKALMMKARLAIAEIDAPNPHKDALLRLLGRGVWRNHWPLSVAKRVLWALPAIAQSQHAPPPDAEKRRVYAAFAALLKPSIEAGWDLFYSWLNYLRPGAPFAQSGGGLTALNSRGPTGGGGSGGGGRREEEAAARKLEEVETCPIDSTSGTTGEGSFTSECFPSPMLEGNPAGRRCPISRATDSWRSSSVVTDFRGLFEGRLRSWSGRSFPGTGGSGWLSCMREEEGFPTTWSVSDLVNSDVFLDWLQRRHPFLWTLILRDERRLGAAAREYLLERDGAEVNRTSKPDV